VRITSVRLVSLSQRAVAAIRYTVEPMGQPLQLVVQSELVANEALPDMGKDPRVAAVLESPLVSEDVAVNNDQRRTVLVHRTKVSGLMLAAGMAHEVTGPGQMSVRTEAGPDFGRCTVAARMAAGERLEVVKYIGYGWSSQRSRPALHDQVTGALALASLTRWDGLLADQRGYLDEFWAGATSWWTATRRSSRRCGSACSTSCSPGPGPSAVRSPPRA
jgi:alpha,alpha-trehalose phosphorylase